MVVAWVPDAGIAVAVASNGPDVRAELLAETLLPPLLAGEPLPLPAGPVDRETLERDAGTYVLPGGDRVEATVAVDGLDLTAVGPEAVEALFPPADDAQREDRAAHERRVLALLAGATDEGRRELQVLEEDIGRVDDIVVVGTVPLEGELRTYLELSVDGQAVPAWYAVDEEGAVAAVELSADPPSLRVVPGDDGRYRPRDAGGGDLSLLVEGDLLLDGPAGRVRAEAAD